MRWGQEEPPFASPPVPRLSCRAGPGSLRVLHGEGTSFVLLPIKDPQAPQSLPPSPPPFLSASGSAGLCFRTAHLLLLSMYFRGRLSRPPQPSARDLTLSPSSIPTHTCSQTDSDMQSHTHRPLPTSPAGPAAAMVVWAGPRRRQWEGTPWHFPLSLSLEALPGSA